MTTTYSASPTAADQDTRWRTRDIVVAAVQSKQVDQPRDRARITARLDRIHGGKPDAVFIGAGRLLEEQGGHVRSPELAERGRRTGPYVANGIVPEDGLQRPHGSRVILGVA